ncbi:MAG: hypothetical protein KDC92_15535, partial [Bacteroidetes bacterium]|nr:hypothetical protein [Bacteroidota bacterium]
IKIISHSQGGAHSQGMAAQLLSYKDEDGNPLYKIEVIYHITPHQPTDIPKVEGVDRMVQYSHPGDAISSTKWYQPLEGLGLNGGSDFGRIKGVDEFVGYDIMGGDNQPPCEGPMGNRCGHNVTDNDYIFDIESRKDGAVKIRLDRNEITNPSWEIK